MDIKKFKEVKDKLWPKAKKELENILKNTKKLIDRGEEYLKVVSEKGADNTRKLSLGLKRERLYYNLGKLAAHAPQGKWGRNKRINSLIKEIKKIDKEVKRTK